MPEDYEDLIKDFIAAAYGVPTTEELSIPESYTISDQLLVAEMRVATRKLQKEYGVDLQGSLQRATSDSQKKDIYRKFQMDQAFDQRLGLITTPIDIDKPIEENAQAIAQDSLVGRQMISNTYEEQSQSHTLELGS